MKQRLLAITVTIAAMALPALAGCKGRPSAAEVAPAAHPFGSEVQLRQQLVRVAQARAPADRIIRGATVLDVVTREWLPDQDIVISGERIAWVGDSGGWPGTAGEIVDASGEYAVPGFGESHKHIESTYLTPEYEAALVIPRGNTWTIEDSHEISNVVGTHNVEFWLRAEQAGSPLKIFPSIGSATPPTIYEHGGGYYGYREMADFLEHDPSRVISLGEVMDWPAVSAAPSAPGDGRGRVWQMIDATIDHRAVVEGHGSGLVKTDEINAFAASGLSSDHEARLPQEGLDKLRRGVFIEARVDLMRTLFPFLIANRLQDWSNLSVTTDDRDVLATQQLGSMDYNIRTAIESGVAPEIAYQLGSYNTARHFHLESILGSIAPGRYADIVLLSDPNTVAITRVFANGRLASKGKDYLLPIPTIDYPAWAHNTIDIGRELKAGDFRIAAPQGRKQVQVALMEPFWFAPDFITDTMPVQDDGSVAADPARGIIKVAVVDRYHGQGNSEPSVSKMFWRKVGPKTPGSALASSQSHDLHNIWVAGNDDAAMALAVNTIAGLHGGWALVSGGRLVASVKLDIGGLMTARPVAEVSGEMEALHSAADAMDWIGSPGLPERMRFAFLTASPWKWQLVAPYDGNPLGFVNVTNGQTHAVVW
jgi:adenine deaminase